VSIARSHFPGVPIILYGHSLGGLAVVVLVLRQDLDVESVIVECPWLSQSPHRPIGTLHRWGASILNYIWPTLPISKGIGGITSDLDNRWTQLMFETPLYVQTVTPRLLVSVKFEQDFVDAANWPNSMPLLFLQGGKDQMVDPSYNERWVPANATFKSYPDGTHFLLKGCHRSEVLSAIFEFISKSTSC
jgi:alpha-beta hydrolase superfamily lysophospholipase